MDERERFIRDDRLALYTMTELCERYGISRKTTGEGDDDGAAAMPTVTATVTPRSSAAPAPTPAPASASQGEPAGFADWWTSLELAALQGLPALESAWGTVIGAFKAHATTVHREAWQALKTQAQHRNGYHNGRAR